MEEGYPDRVRTSPLLIEMVRQDRLGQKSAPASASTTATHRARLRTLGSSRSCIGSSTSLEQEAILPMSES